MRKGKWRRRRDLKGKREDEEKKERRYGYDMGLTRIWPREAILILKRKRTKLN